MDGVMILHDAISEAKAYDSMLSWSLRLRKRLQLSWRRTVDADSAGSRIVDRVNRVGTSHHSPNPETHVSGD